MCGHSYGGNVALHAALAQRERVKGLLLLEPVFMRGLDLAGERAVLQETHAFFSSYTDRVAGGDPEAVSLMIDFWFGSGAFPKLPAPVQDFLRGAAAKNAEDVKASFAEVITRAPLASFDRPVVIAYGGASPPVAPAIANALTKLLPKTELHAIPDATHGMLDSHAEPVARLIDNFRAC
jgi:pimeloyl-ACP methyl ester carboxylesterase